MKKIRKNASLKSVALSARKRAKVLLREWVDLHQHAQKNWLGPEGFQNRCRADQAHEHYRDVADLADHLARLAGIESEDA